MNSFAKYLACLMITLSACERVDGYLFSLKAKWHDRREKAFRNDMEQIYTDRQHTYRLDYRLSDSGLKFLVEREDEFRRIQHGQFDISPWLRAMGIEPIAKSQAVFDPAKRTLTITDSGPNIFSIEVSIEPLVPMHYSRVKGLP